MHERLLQMGISVNRPISHRLEKEMPSVLLQRGLHSGFPVACLLHPLNTRTNVCLPLIPPDIEGSEETEARCWIDDHDSLAWARQFWDYDMVNLLM